MRRIDFRVAIAAEARIEDLRSSVIARHTLPSVSCLPATRVAGARCTSRRTKTIQLSLLRGAKEQESDECTRLSSTEYTSR